MKIEIDRKLYEIISEEYSSIEYILEETIPAISRGKLKKLPAYHIGGTDTVSVDIADDIIYEIKDYLPEDGSLDDMINYIVGIGFIMGV